MGNKEGIVDSKKCVLVIDNTQSTGIIANTASILSITLGNRVTDIVSHDVYDKQGEVHLGITQIPIPILGASKEKIKEIRDSLFSVGEENLVIVDFTNIAQRAKDYSTYESDMLISQVEDINYIGIGICGDKKLINKTTGNLSLIR